MRTLLVLGACCVFLVACLAFAVFVFPTAWRYERSPNHLVRINRFSGDTEYLTTSGWRPAGLVSAGPTVPIRKIAATFEQCEAHRLKKEGGRASKDDPWSVFDESQLDFSGCWGER